MIYDFDIRKKTLWILDGPAENLVPLLFRLLACIFILYFQKGGGLLKNTTDIKILPSLDNKRVSHIRLNRAKKS